MIPNPGSDEAIEQGCLCPVLDNGHGRESMFGPNVWIFRADCPVHRPKLTIDSRGDDCDCEICDECDWPQCACKCYPF